MAGVAGMGVSAGGMVVERRSGWAADWRGMGAGWAREQERRHACDMASVFGSALRVERMCLLPKSVQPEQKYQSPM